MNFPAPTPRQGQLIWFAITMLAVTLTVAIVGAVLWGLGRALVVLSPVLWPIAVAGIVAFILDPVVEWFIRKGIPRLRAILLVFSVAVIAFLGVAASIVPRVVVEARDLARQIPGYVGRAQAKMEKWINKPPTPLLRLLPLPWRDDPTNATPASLTSTNESAHPDSPPSEDAAENDDPPLLSLLGLGGTPSDNAAPSATDPPWWIKALDPNALRTAGGWLATILPDVGRWLIGQLGKVASWIGVLVGLALIPIYTFFFLLEKSSIERQWTRYVPLADSQFKDEIVWLLRNINDALIVFFRGQVLVAICDGVMYTIGFLIIGLPYALLLGLVATVLTIVPFLGAIVTCVSALIIAFVQFGDWQHPLLVLVVFCIVQTIEGWIVQPKIIGDRVGLHPVTIIIALLVGTTLMGGLLGGLLAIPATAVLRALLFRYVWHKRIAEPASTLSPEPTAREISSA
ncbi:MAG: AI-2E family transporter [Verrucomicrobiae bacterium]|nr:AI-2E family transporter [Verrucomicrobiae bacterium]